jgi:type 1 glutamine amidotransferase
MGSLTKAVVALALVLAAELAGADDIQRYYFKGNTIRVLILSGRNNHDWRASTPFLRRVLEDTGRFDVRVEEEPNGITAATLAPFDVLVIDYCGPRWGDVTETAVESFVHSGKGLVAVHAASYPFGDQVILGANQTNTAATEPIWPAWRRMLGVYWDMKSEPRTGHASRYTFQIKFTDREHPIIKGLEGDYFGTDEFFTKFRYEPGVKVNVIATAFDDPKFGGTGKDEPVLMTLQYGQGRVFHTILGHDMAGLVEPGFVTTFARGTEWAATGSVTVQPPKAVSNPVRALVVTGGHAYDTSFYSLFEGHEDLIWDHAPSNEAAFQRDLRKRYDVLVLYDYSMDLSEAGRKNLRDFVEAGKGVVVLHHAIADYTSWPWWWEEVVGGRYLLKPDRDLPASTFKEGEDMKVTVVGRHPVTAGLGAMHLKDEAYKGMQISKSVTVLLRTDNPAADGPLAWVNPYQKSRVVYIALGHGREAHLYPPYRQLVQNAIQWAGGIAAR